ncbi:MAG: polysaccharide deacetylase family protein [archaeon]
MRNIFLTFDLEEWRIPEHNNVMSRLNATTSFSRDGTLKLLKLLRNHNAKATFFVTGYFAEREPKLVKKIHDEGHEVASHSYKDVSHYDLSPEEIKRSVERADKIIKKIIGKKPYGFRTPQFSITQPLSREIIRQGYSYDSSTNPAIFPRYRKITVQNDEMIEIPVSSMPIMKLPISWLWMRNIGLWWTKLGVWLNLKLGRDAVLYFHPWEFVQLPKIKGVPFYITRGCGEIFTRKLERLMIAFKKHEFRMMKDLR